MTQPPENPVVEKSGWPEGYAMREKGLYHVSGSELLLCQPFEVLGAGLTPEGTGQAVVIAFRDVGGEEKKALIAKADLVGSAQKTLRQLIGAGFSIEFDENCWRLLQLFFLRLHPAQSCEIVSCTGWARRCFVLPEQVIGPEAGAIYYAGSSLARDAGSRGTLQQWQDHIASHCQGNSRMVFALSLGFAAPFLPLVGAEPAVFNLVGPGSCGKTTVLRCADSLAGPVSRLASWQAGASGLQSAASATRHQLLILDDFGQNTPRQARSMISDLTSSGYAALCPDVNGHPHRHQRWQSLTLSAGLIGMGELCRSDGQAAFGGQRAHFIDIPAQAGKGFGVFDDLRDHASAGEFAEYLLRQSQDYYGTALPAFLEALCRDNHDRLIEEYREAESLFLEQVLAQQAQGELRRIARRFFLAGFGGELAIRYRITPWEEGHAMQAAYHLFKIWHQQFCGMASLDAGEVLDQVRNFLEAQHHRFMILGAAEDAGKQKNIPRNLAGYCVTKAGQQHHYIKARIFSREVLKGFDRTSAIEVLRQAGILIAHPGTGEVSQNKRLPKGNCAAQRVYHLVDALFDRQAQKEDERQKNDLKSLFG